MIANFKRSGDKGRARRDHLEDILRRYDRQFQDHPETARWSDRLEVKIDNPVNMIHAYRLAVQIPKQILALLDFSFYPDHIWRENLRFCLSDAAWRQNQVFHARNLTGRGMCYINCLWNLFGFSSDEIVASAGNVHRCWSHEYPQNRTHMQPCAECGSEGRVDRCLRCQLCGDCGAGDICSAGPNAFYPFQAHQCAVPAPPLHLEPAGIEYEPRRQNLLLLRMDDVPRPLWRPVIPVLPVVVGRGAAAAAAAGAVGPGAGAAGPAGAAGAAGAAAEAAAIVAVAAAHFNVHQHERPQPPVPSRLVTRSLQLRLPPPPPPRSAPIRRPREVSPQQPILPSQSIVMMSPQIDNNHLQLLSCPPQQPFPSPPNQLPRFRIPSSSQSRWSSSPPSIIPAAMPAYSQFSPPPPYSPPLMLPPPCCQSQSVPSPKEITQFFPSPPWPFFPPIPPFPSMEQPPPPPSPEPAPPLLPAESTEIGDGNILRELELELAVHVEVVRGGMRFYAVNQMGIRDLRFGYCTSEAKLFHKVAESLGTQWKTRFETKNDYQRSRKDKK
jgi:hypothetical protein